MFFCVKKKELKHKRAVIVVTWVFLISNSRLFTTLLFFDSSQERKSYILNQTIKIRLKRITLEIETPFLLLERNGSDRWWLR